MSTYKGIQGTAVTNYAGDKPGVVDGEVWYDSTAAAFKYQYLNVTTAGAWATGENLNTARDNSTMSGTKDASIIATGENPSGTNIGFVELYNGTSWTETTNVNSARRLLGGNGTSTSNLIYGGFIAGNTNATESWNGSAWTEVNNLNTTRRTLSGAGADNTSGLAIGGLTTVVVANTETWNGTSWTEVNDLNTARRASNGVGIQTAALMAGGNTGSNVTITESWNGSSWTEVADLNTAGIVGAGGTQTSALAFGRPSSSVLTELWNGSTWAETTDMNVGRQTPQGSGSSNTSALAASGYNTAPSAATEEWTGAGQPVGAWSTGGSLNTARQQVGSSGTQTAAIAFGGSSPTIVGNTELYDGTSWTEVNDLNTARAAMGPTKGPSTSVLSFGGYNPPGAFVRAFTESWNGSSWTEVADLNTARRSLGGAGESNTAALAFGGTTGSDTAVTETWNGTSWTEVNDMNSARRSFGNTGATNTAALAFGGVPNIALTESWNGTSWTEVNDLNRGVTSSGGLGTNTSALCFGGDITIVVANTEEWSGTRWTNVSDLNTARNSPGGAGTTSAGLAIGGNINPPITAATEEWNSPSNVIKTITTS